MHRRHLLKAATALIGPAGLTGLTNLNAATGPAPLTAQALAQQVAGQLQTIQADLAHLPQPMRIMPRVGVRFEPFIIGIELRSRADTEVVLPLWEQLSPDYQAIFKRWTRMANAPMDERAFFTDTFQWALVAHEVGHLLSADHRPKGHRWPAPEEERLCNRFMVAWCRLRSADHARLDAIGAVWASLHERLPNPLPAGADPHTWLVQNYDKATEQPDVYGWFQYGWMAQAWKDRERLSLADTVAQLTNPPKAS